jgi:recombinational DNA repair protein (RecF pathway)
MPHIAATPLTTRSEAFFFATMIRMYEYLSEAVVLRSEPRNAQDARVSFFTKKYGKLIGKATSARKITSKLNGHLQPGYLIQLRIVERGGLQIVDALKKTQLALNPTELAWLSELLPETEPEQELWDLLASGRFSWADALRILGWDPREGKCRLCGRPPHSFRTRDQEFFCLACTSKVRPQEVLYIGTT